MKIFDESVLKLPFFEERHRELAADLEAWVIKHRDLPRDHSRSSVSDRGRLYAGVLAADGWLSYAIDVSPGMHRPDLRSLCLVREALAYMDDLVDFAFAVQGLGAAPVAWYGSSQQRSDLLPSLRNGTGIASLALSEPECGSNLAALALKAQTRPDGYAVDGMKTWVSNGSIADYHSVLARTGEGPGGLGLSFLLAPRTSKGLSIAEEIDLVAPRSFASLAFEDCRLPSAALIGEPGMGYRYAMDVLNFFRVTVGAAAIGFCRKALHASTDWARKRDVAGSKLIQAQMTIEKIANMSLYLDSSSLLVARAAWEMDTGCDDVVAHASMAKLYATDGAAKVIDDAVQLFGAAGLVAGAVPELLYRQVRGLRIYEGTSEIQKMIIAGAVSRKSA